MYEQKIIFILFLKVYYRCFATVCTWRNKNTYVAKLLIFKMIPYFYDEFFLVNRDKIYDIHLT